MGNARLAPAGDFLGTIIQDLALSRFGSDGWLTSEDLLKRSVAFMFLASDKPMSRPAFWASIRRLLTEVEIVFVVCTASKGDCARLFSSYSIGEGQFPRVTLLISTVHYVRKLFPVVSFPAAVVLSSSGVVKKVGLLKIDGAGAEHFARHDPTRERIT